MNSFTAKPDPGVSTTAAGQISWGVNALLWKLQGYGLLGITLLSFFPPLFRLQEHFFFVLLAGALYLAWVEKLRPVAQTPINFPLLGFVLWVLGTVPFALDPGYSFSELRKFMSHVVVFYWAMFLLRQRGNIKLSEQVLWVVMFGSLVLSGVALVDFVMRGGTWKDRVVRAEAPYSDYNWLTTYLVLVIPILIGLVAVHRALWLRVVVYLTLITAVFAQVAAYTRAGWLGHFAQAVGFCLITGRRRLVIWILAGAVTLAGGLVGFSLLGYQQGTIDPWTLTARLKTWNLALEDVMTHPIVGIGYGNYTFLKQHAAEIEAEKDKAPGDRVLPGIHSTFGMVLLGSGVPALIFFVWILIATIWQLASAAQHPMLRQNGMHIISVTIALAVIGFAVRNVFDYMFAGSLAWLFWILVAVGFSMGDNHRKSLSLLNPNGERIP